MLGRLIRYVLTLAVIVSLFSSIGYAANSGTTVYIDGVKQSKLSALISQNQQTYMPMLDLGTRLGYSFTKDTISGNTYYYLSKGTRKVQLSINQNRIWLNGKLQSLPTSILVKRGVTYLSLQKVKAIFAFDFTLNSNVLRLTTKVGNAPTPTPKPSPIASPSPSATPKKLVVTYITGGLEIDAPGFTTVTHKYVWKQKANLKDSIELSIKGVQSSDAVLAGGKVYVNKVMINPVSTPSKFVRTTIELKKATTYRIVADKQTGKIKVLFLGGTPTPTLNPSPSPSPSPSISPSPSPTSTNGPGSLGTIVYVESGVEINTTGLTGVTDSYVKANGTNAFNQIVLDLKGVQTQPVTLAGGKIFVEQVRAQQLSMNPVVTRLTIVLKKETAYYVTTSNGKVTVTFGTAPTTSPVPGLFKVVLDPGHGGKDPGAIGLESKFESMLNLAVGIKVYEKLKNVPNVQVYMTRNTNTFIELTARSSYANQLAAHLFIAIHANASISANANGVETHYYQNDENVRGVQSKRYANLVQAELVKATGFKNNGIMANNGLNVIRNTKMPAVLLELGYLTNTGNNTALWNNATQDRIAQGIVNAIVAYKNAN